MKLENLLDVKLLNEHIQNGLVSVRSHPHLPLFIYNYTPKVRQECWGDGTIDYCRGLIVNNHGYVIARPFKKFHNFNTISIPETLEENLPTNIEPWVTEKMDGSLGILYHYGCEHGIATRGSFTSDQAKWADSWYANKLETGELSLITIPGVTPIFEIIYPENRIVCQYDFEGLVLLSMVDNETGREWSPEETKIVGRGHGFEGNLIVKNYRNREIIYILSDNETNREGYVLTYDTGSEPPIKVKVKFDEYVKMHRVVTGVSPKAIWELLSSGKDRSFIETAPEHFKSWAENWIDKLFDDFNLIFTAAADIYLTRPYRWPDYADDRVYRSLCAKYFKERAGQTGMPNGVLGIAFAMLDGKQGHDLDSMIWPLVKPRGDDQSFRIDGE
jgi:RNA ligase